MANTKITTNVIADDAVGSAQLASGLTLGGNTTFTGNISTANLSVTSTNWLGFGDYGERISGNNSNSTLTFLTDATLALTLNSSQHATFTSGITVGGNIANTSGDMTIDVVGDIILDADGGDIILKDGGTTFGQFSISSGDLFIQQPTANKDIVLRGYDGSNYISALTLDMSAGGDATFAGSVIVNKYLRLRTTDDQAQQWYLYTHTDDTFRINYNGAGTDALLIDTSENFTINGEVTFNDDIGLGMNGASFGTGVPTINFKGTSNANTRAGAINFKENNNDDVAALYVTDGSDTYGTVLCAYQGDIKFSTGTLAGYKMTVKSDGKVGIGLTNPARRKLEIMEGSPGFVLHDSDVTNLTHEIIGGGNAGLEISADYQNVATGYIRFDVGGVERMRILDAGAALQIGATSDKGFVDFDGSSLQLNTQRNPNTGTFSNTSKSHAGITLVGNSADSHVKFYTASANNTTATDRGRINKFGYLIALGAGGSSYDVAAQQQHEFVGNTAGWVAAKVKASGGVNTNQYGLNIQTTVDQNNSTNYFLICYGASTVRAAIRTNGDFESSSNSYNGVSDLKLKENIVDSGSQWNDIKALKVRKYSFKDEKSDSPTQLGVIAQEVETAGMSGLVQDSPDEDSPEGEVKHTGTVTKKVKYSVLYMKGIKALQEAMARIETLEAEVKALKDA